MLVSFCTELRVAKGSGATWRTLAPFVAQLEIEPADDVPSGLFGSGGLWKIDAAPPYTIVVPADFETDFASVPRLPLVYLFTGDVCHRAPLLHDYLYGQGKPERAWCDRIFLEAMRAEGVSWIRRQAMYAAVRAAGGGRYGARS